MRGARRVSGVSYIENPRLIREKTEKLTRTWLSGDGKEPEAAHNPRDDGGWCGRSGGCEKGCCGSGGGVRAGIFAGRRTADDNHNDRLCEKPGERPGRTTHGRNVTGVGLV